MSSTMQNSILGFDHITDLYAHDVDFGQIWIRCLEGPQPMFVIGDDFLYYGKQLCIPQGSLHEVIVHEAYKEGLAGHFRQTKTLRLVQENFYWPKMVRDVNKLVE